MDLEHAAAMVDRTEDELVFRGVLTSIEAICKLADNYAIALVSSVTDMDELSLIHDYAR